LTSHVRAPQRVGTLPQLLNRLRMRQVALMLALRDHRTLRAAAAELGMSQPAASKMLQELETALGQPLFERAGRGLSLTEAGRCATEHFHGIHGTVEALTQELHELRSGGAGTLRVGSVMAASPDCLTEALIRLKAAWPLLTIRVEIDTSDRLTEHLREGSVDIVIGRVPDVTRRDFIVRPIADEALSIVAAPGHPLAGKRRLAFAALQAFPWVFQLAGSPMRDVVEQEFRGHHTPLPGGMIETSSILTTTNLLMRTTMIGVVPESVALRFEAHGLLRVLDYRIGHRLPSYGSIVRRDRPVSRSAERLLELLHERPMPRGKPVRRAATRAA